jgi:hypothetical protein
MRGTEDEEEEEEEAGEDHAVRRLLVDEHEV